MVAQSLGHPPDSRHRLPRLPAAGFEPCVLHNHAVLFATIMSDINRCKYVIMDTQKKPCSNNLLYLETRMLFLQFLFSRVRVHGCQVGSGFMV